MTSKNELIKQAKETVQYLPPIGVERPRPFTWEHHRQALREHILQGNSFDEFLRWSTIEATMVVGNVPYVKKEYSELVLQRYSRALEEPNIGSPHILDTGAVTTSPNLIHQVYHLYQWEKITGKKVEDLRTIVEFGGGYGAMCYVCHKMGFKGEYIIYDLPEFSVMQKYYLSSIGYYPVYSWVTGENHLDVPNKHADLLIACYSLSEVSEKLRNLFLDTVKAKSYVFAIQEYWDGNNVLSQFLQLIDEHPNCKWSIYPNRNISGNWYCIGDSKP